MMNKLYRRVVGYIMQTKMYRYLLKHVIPYIRFTTYYTNLRGKKYHALYQQLIPGDIILTIDKKKLTTLLIPGEFSHAAMCVSLDAEWEVSEMTHSDYTKSCFFDICKESDRVVIMRCKKITEEQLTKAIEKCKSLEDATYDSEFSLGIKELYCSELIYVSYENNLIEANLEDFVGLGRDYISPVGLYHAKNLKIVIDSDLL
jgi:uncharacterized protein YycO